MNSIQGGTVYCPVCKEEHLSWELDVVDVGWITIWSPECNLPGGPALQLLDNVPIPPEIIQ